ncbi:MAG: PQQ-binding-like beta-propeller repeat protein [Planctomycetaceae bacterium]|nr:PQQ-binding-like beta-propeller repeat protein [Planctomycetaceae bacterium]
MNADADTFRTSRRHCLRIGVRSAAGLLAAGLFPGRFSVFAGSTAVDTGWSSFRNGPAQRGLATCTLAAQPEVKWELASADGWVAACAIAGSHVYAPALQGYLHCLDRATGNELWKYRSIDSTDEKKFAPGFKAAPLVTEQAVYIGDEDGVLHAVDRTTGKLMWKYVTDAEIAGGVAAYGDHLLLASHDSFLYCLGRDGQEQWKFQTNDRINCSPGIADHFTFVSGCDEHLRVIDLMTGEKVRDVPMESYLIASPAIVDEMLYVGSHAGDVAAVNWQTGNIVWRYQGERQMPYHASAAVTDELVLVGSHDKLFHAIERSSGKAKWTFPTKAKIESSAAVADERVFFGSGDGNLYGVRLADGKEVWKFNAGKPINAGIAIGEGCLVVGEDSQDGKLRCYA